MLCTPQFQPSVVNLACQSSKEGCCHIFESVLVHGGLFYPLGAAYLARAVSAALLNGKITGRLLQSMAPTCSRVLENLQRVDLNLCAPAYVLSESDGILFQHCGVCKLCCCALIVMQAATEYGANWPKAWHHWALFNCGVLEALHKRGEAAAAGQYVAPAVTGFFRR